METYTIQIFRDNVLLKTFMNEKSDFCALKWMLNNNSSSCDWALKYEGYKVKITNEQTSEVTFWKHSGQK